MKKFRHAISLQRKKFKETRNYCRHVLLAKVISGCGGLVNWIEISIDISTKLTISQTGCWFFNLFFHWPANNPWSSWPVWHFDAAIILQFLNSALLNYEAISLNFLPGIFLRLKLTISVLKIFVNIEVQHVLTRHILLTLSVSLRFTKTNNATTWIYNQHFLK